MQLKDCTEIRVGLPLERRRAAKNSTLGVLYKSVTQKSFSAKPMDNLDFLDNFIAAYELEPQFLTRDEDILVRLRSPNQVIYINKNNTGYVIPALMAIIRITRPDLINAKFLNYYLNSEYIQNQLVKDIKGTTILMITAQNLAELEINLPSLREQMKIVNYLETAYAELEILQQLIHKKSQLKDQILNKIIMHK